MPTLITTPTIIKAAGQPPKEIREHIGRVNSDSEALSIAHMKSPAGWSEPGQRPRFDEYSIVLAGMLRVECEDGSAMEVVTGQAVIARKGEWVRYSSPSAGGAEYISVCLPAFSLDLSNRDVE